MYKRILVPLDGSALAESVLPVAAFFAETAKAQILLLHVLERDAPNTIHGDRHLRAADEAEAYLKNITRTAFAEGTDVARHVHGEAVTHVAGSLAGHASEFAPDLVLLCAHGDGAWRDTLYGNIAQQVVDLGKTPVLLIRNSGDGKLIFPYRRILVPIDGKPSHEAGLPGATDLAELCKAELRLLMVVPTLSTLTGNEAATGSMLPGSTRAVLDLAQERAVEHLGECVAPLRERGVSVSACVARGDPLERIEGEFHRCDADLVVLATHGKAGLKAFWAGSLASKLLKRIPVSFLLVPAQNSPVPQ
ncbi:MAG: universal stress protein [Candidatus Riflebacteria bacterium]|nr:universal stress protein [Candidatus Riflebacteria bacterium]